MSFPQEWTHGTDEEWKKDQREASKNALTGFLQADADARAALAALHPWSPDLRPYWDRVPIDESDFEQLLRLLHDRRETPTTRFDDHGVARLLP